MKKIIELMKMGKKIVLGENELKKIEYQTQNLKGLLKRMEVEEMSNNDRLVVDNTIDLLESITGQVEWEKSKEYLEKNVQLLVLTRAALGLSRLKL